MSKFTCSMPAISSLESHAPEIAAIIRDFLARKLTQRVQAA
jgi:hypothetical protein